MHIQIHVENISTPRSAGPGTVAGTTMHPTTLVATDVQSFKCRSSTHSTPELAAVAKVNGARQPLRQADPAALGRLLATIILCAWYKKDKFFFKYLFRYSVDENGTLGSVFR